MDTEACLSADKGAMTLGAAVPAAAHKGLQGVSFPLHMCVHKCMVMTSEPIYITRRNKIFFEV